MKLQDHRLQRPQRRQLQADLAEQASGDGESSMARGVEPAGHDPSPAGFADLGAQAHAVAPRGGEPGYPQPLGQRVAQGVDGGDGPDGMRPSGVRHAPGAPGRVVQVGVRDAPRMQQAAQLLVQRHERGEAPQLVVAVEDVPYEPRASGERDGRAIGQVGRAAGGMRGRRADVGADHLRGHDQFGPALDVDAVARVVGVGPPDAVRVHQHAGVGAGAARRAALDLQTGEFAAQLVEQMVAGLGLRVQPVPSVVHRLGDVAVVVPFDVVDAEVPDQPGHLPVDVRVGVRVGQVEHVLVAVRDVAAARHRLGGGQDPVGMLPVQVRFEVDHLRFEPQSEFHAQAVHVPGQSVEPVRPDRGIDRPVPQSLGIVAAQVEPSVVEHEPLHAYGGGAVGEPHERRLVVVEVHGLPGVERERTGLGDRVHAPGHRAHPIVEPNGHSVESTIGIREADVGSPVRLPRRQHDLAGAGQFAGAKQRLMRGEIVEPVGLVAAPREVAGPDLALRPPRRAVGEDEHPRGVVAGLAAAAVARDRADGHRGGRRLLLQRPASGELGERVDASGNGQDRVEPVDGEQFGGSGVGVGQAAGDRDEPSGPDRQRQFETYAVDGVVGDDLETVADDDPGPGGVPAPDGDAFAVGAVEHPCPDLRPPGEHRRSATVRLESGPSGPRLGALRQQRRPPGRVGPVRRGVLERHRVQRLENPLVAHGAEIATSVFDLRHLVAGNLHYDADAVASEDGVRSVVEHQYFLRKINNISNKQIDNTNASASNRTGTIRSKSPTALRSNL